MVPFIRSQDPLDYCIIWKQFGFLQSKIMIGVAKLKIGMDLVISCGVPWWFLRFYPTRVPQPRKSWPMEYVNFNFRWGPPHGLQQMRRRQNITNRSPTWKFCWTPLLWSCDQLHLGLSLLDWSNQSESHSYRPMDWKLVKLASGARPHQQFQRNIFFEISIN